MLAEVLQDRAALYVAGAMTAPERENFELILEFHQPLQSYVAGLQETAVAVLMTRVPLVKTVPEQVKHRILGAVEVLPAKREPVAMVVTNAAGLIEWINPAFTVLCGYTLDELRGRKPGQLLQGPATDQAAVARIRTAVKDRAACEETLVNYHKDGSLYRVKLNLTPILDDDRQPLWFIAKEQKLSMVA